MLFLTHLKAITPDNLKEREMKTVAEKKISKLEVTLRQWEEIISKEMAMSADLRNQKRAVEAFAAKLEIEAMINELRVHG